MRLSRVLLLAVCLPAASQAQRCPVWDTVYYNGNILTGRGLPGATPERVKSMAIEDGRIVAIDATDSLQGCAKLNIDLHGAFVMPGFNDAHTHIASAGLQRLSVNLDDVPTLAAMQQTVKTYAATLLAGAWIVGGGWDHTKWPSKTLPTRQDLDAVSGGHPAFLERTDGHIAILNTAALEAAHIHPETPNPAGGQFDHDADGNLTGIVREGPALSMVQAVIPKPSFEVRRKALGLSMEDALAHGVTSVQDFSDWEDWLVLEELEHTHKLRLRVYEWIDFNLPLAVLKERRKSHPANDPWLHLGNLKAFMDGSLGSRTAALEEPYSDDTGNSGITRFDQQKLNQMANERAAAGFQLGFHAIGDLANNMALDAFASAEQVASPASSPLPPEHPDAAIVETPTMHFKPVDLRFRIEHAQVVTPDAFDRFHDLGVIASMQPVHLLTDMAWAGDRLGPERSRSAYAWRSFLNHHVTLAFGTDYPVESINPFRGLYAAVTRQNEAGTKTFEPQERISLNEALYAYTQASAFAEFREHEKGLLEKGYLADFIVLDRDITKASPQELLHTKVLQTVLNGEVVYSAATPGAAARAK